MVNMSAPPTPMLRPSANNTTTCTDLPITGPSTSNIQYVCDHFRSLDAMWKGWVEVACASCDDRNSTTTTSMGVKSAVKVEGGGGDDVDVSEEVVRRQRAIRKLADVFKYCYVTPLVTSKLADAPTPRINRSKQKSTSTTATNTMTAAGWGCFDDAAADDEAPPVLLTSQTNRHSSQSGGGGKRPRDELLDQNGDHQNHSASPLLFRGSDVLHADATSPGNALVLAKDAMDSLLTSIDEEREGTNQQNRRRHGGASSSIHNNQHHHNQLEDAARRVLSEGVASLREMGGSVPDELGDEPGRPVVTMHSIDEGPQHNNNSQHTPLYDLYVYEQLLPTMGVGIDASGDEVTPALSDVHPLAAWLKLCEMAAQECRAGASSGISCPPSSSSSSSTSTSIISQQEIAILKSESCSIPFTTSPLPLLLPLVLFVVLGFSNATLMERRLLQLLRRERRARKCAVADGATIIATTTTSAVTKDTSDAAHRKQGISREKKEEGGSSTVKLTPTSAATYVKTKRGCLSLVCDDDDEDEDEDEVQVPAPKRVEVTTEPSDSVSKILDYAYSQDESLSAAPIPLPPLSSSLTTKTPTTTEKSNTRGASSQKNNVSVSGRDENVDGPPALPIAAGNISQTPQGRKSIVSLSDNTSPRQHPPRPPRSPSVSTSPSDGPEDAVDGGKASSSSSSVVSDVGGVARNDAEASGDDVDEASSSPSSTASTAPTSDKKKKKNTMRNRKKNKIPKKKSKSNVAEVNDVDDFPSSSAVSSGDDDELLGLCSDSSFETSDDDDDGKGIGNNKAPKKKACAKCHSSKGDLHICPRCKLHFHEKCGGPHPREDDADAAEFTQLMKTVSTSDLSKKEVFGKIAGDFWGDDSDEDADGLSPHDHRLRMAATMVCIGCCAEQGLSAYRHEPASTPTHSDSGSSNDDEDDDDAFSTDSSDIRAAELEEALDTSRIERELALLRGPKYDPMKEKIKNDKLLLLTQMAPSDGEGDATDEEEIARREKKIRERKLGNQIAEENLKRRGCKYVVTEAAEEVASGDDDDAARSSGDGDEDHPRRQKAEKGFLRHKRDTEERVRRIRKERAAQAAAASSTGGDDGRPFPSTPSTHPDVVIVSPDTSQRPTNPPPSSSESYLPPRSSRRRRRPGR